MIMNFTPEQIASTNKAGIEAILGLAHTQFSAFERLSALYFNATKAAFEEGVGHAKALLDAKDPQDYLTLHAAATQPTMERAHPKRPCNPADDGKSHRLLAQPVRSRRPNERRIGQVPRSASRRV